MATSRKHASPTTKRHPAPAASLLFHRIAALLHTVRSIAHHEDELCTLLHAAKNNLDPDLEQDLRQLLDAMPSDDYTSDLDALKDALGDAQPPSAAKPTKPQSARKTSQLPVKAPARAMRQVPAKADSARHRASTKKTPRRQPS